jgi:hypothetical protein
MLVHKKAQCSLQLRIKELEASGMVRVPDTVYWLGTRDFETREESSFVTMYKTHIDRWSATIRDEPWTTQQIAEIALAVEKLYPEAYKTVKRNFVLRALFEEGFDAMLIIAADGKKS